MLVLKGLIVTALFGLGGVIVREVISRFDRMIEDRRIEKRRK